MARILSAELPTPPAAATLCSAVAALLSVDMLLSFTTVAVLAMILNISYC